MKEITKTSRLAGQLEKLYNKLNEDFFGGVMTDPVITIQSTPKAYGHYTLYDAWNVKGEGRREINIGAGTLYRPIENVLATLLHEMCHQYNDTILDMKDCSGSGNTYHNKVFKQTAESHGLIVNRSDRYGWSHTEPGDKLIEWILENNIQDIRLSRSDIDSLGNVKPTTTTKDKGEGENTEGKKKSNVRRYVCPQCGMIVRSTKDVNVGCWDCMVQMERKEKD